MEQFYTLLTDVGKAKIANATALQTKVKFTKLLVGDGNGSYYDPSETQTKLKNKVWEGGIGNISIDKDNPNWIVLESVIPSNVGGFTIREIAIEDEEGDLVVIAKYPATYKPKIEDGSTKDLIIKTILEVTNVDTITLKVDPTVILATQKDVKVLENKIKENNKVLTDELEKITTNIKNIDLNAEKVKLESDNFKATNVKDAFNELYKELGSGELKTSQKDIKGAINEVFISANNSLKELNNNKEKLKKAIVGLGGDTNGDTLENLINSLNKVKKGKGFVSGTVISTGQYSNSIEIKQNFGFEPSSICVIGLEGAGTKVINFYSKNKDYQKVIGNTIIGCESFDSTLRGSMDHDDWDGVLNQHGFKLNLTSYLGHGGYENKHCAYNWYVLE